MKNLSKIIQKLLEREPEFSQHTVVPQGTYQHLARQPHFGDFCWEEVGGGSIICHTDSS